MNAMPPKLPKRVRIREKYSPVPTAREKAYHIWLMETYPCVCGCGGQSTHAHHVLGHHPLKRWRRDHEMVVPMLSTCHERLHLHDPREQHEFAGLADKAAVYRQHGYDEGKL